MTTGTGSHSAIAYIEANSQPFEDAPQPAASASVGVSDVCQTGLTPMTDSEREQAIQRAGAAMQGWYSQFQQTGNTDCLDRAYHCMGIQKRLLDGRSAAFVAKLEAERGLR